MNFDADLTFVDRHSQMESLSRASMLELIVASDNTRRSIALGPTECLGLRFITTNRNEEVIRREAAGPEDPAPRQTNTKVEPLCAIAAARVEGT